MISIVYFLQNSISVKTVKKIIDMRTGISLGMIIKNGIVFLILYHFFHSFINLFLICSKSIQMSLLWQRSCLIIGGWLWCRVRSQIAAAQIGVLGGADGPAGTPCCCGAMKPGGGGFGCAGPMP
jgi:hypothetical protein